MTIELTEILTKSNSVKIKHYNTAIAVIHCCGAFLYYDSNRMAL